VQQKSISSADGVEWVEQKPQEGDLVRRWVGRGDLRHYIEYTYSEPKPDPITMDKMVWLRSHLGEPLESALRLRIANRDGSDKSKRLEVFVSMVDARSDLILSDQGYADGIDLMLEMDLIDQKTHNHLISLGQISVKL